MEQEKQIYSQEAKARWGQTETFREYEQKTSGKTAEEKETSAKELLHFFREFGRLKQKDPGSPEACAEVKRLQEYITEHFYTCTDEILQSLGEMYVSDPRFTETIDREGGTGCAAFVKAAIESALG